MSFFCITVDPPERWDECTLVYTYSDVYDIEVRKLGILRVSLALLLRSASLYPRI